MNELDVLHYFYDQIIAQGVTRTEIFLNIDQLAADVIAQKTGNPVDLPTLEGFTDICIANEWLERTTADPNYKYLSLTEAGLQILLASEYT